MGGEYSVKVGMTGSKNFQEEKKINFCWGKPLTFEKYIFCLIQQKIMICFVEQEADLHNFSGVPMYGVVVEISSWVKPRVELLLLASISLCVDVSVDNVRLSRNIPQELIVYFVMVAPTRG